MNKFSQKSLERLNTCHPDLQKVFNKVIENYDCTIICGHRGKDEQDEAVRLGKSKLQWPNSKHNQLLSLAVDVAPYPINFENKHKKLARFYHFAGFFMATAETMGIKLRWGGDWDRDLDFEDQNFDDLPHFELVEEKT